MSESRGLSPCSAFSSAALDEDCGSSLVFEALADGLLLLLKDI